MKALSLLGLLLMLAPPVASAKPETRKKKTSRAGGSVRQAATPIPLPSVVPEDPSEIALIAKGAVVLDAFSGSTIFGKNETERFYPASATKILTALLVIEAGDLDRPVVIEPVDTQVEPSAVYFKPGEQFTRRALLYALMLKSANDVAQALARDNAGSVAAFAEKMTLRAKQLGAADSHFMNPHGLHHPEHYTTPLDLALIARAAMQQPVFREFVGTLSYQWVGANGAVRLDNHNKMLRSFPGCTGLKTGYTLRAQHVLVSSALRDHREVICVVMHSDKPGKWTDSSLLLTYALAHPPKDPELD